MSQQFRDNLWMAVNYTPTSKTVVNRWDEKAGLLAGCGVRSQVIDVLKVQIKGDRQ